jgi:hypothetical protein
VVVVAHRWRVEARPWAASIDGSSPHNGVMN